MRPGEQLLGAECLKLGSVCHTTRWPAEGSETTSPGGGRARARNRQGNSSEEPNPTAREGEPRTPCAQQGKGKPGCHWLWRGEGAGRSRGPRPAGRRHVPRGWAPAGVAGGLSCNVCVALVVPICQSRTWNQRGLSRLSSD